MGGDFDASDNSIVLATCQRFRAARALHLKNFSGLVMASVDTDLQRLVFGVELAAGRDPPCEVATLARRSL
jgi:hypothetical protein